MVEQLLIRVAPELKSKLNKLATLEGKTSSQVVRDLIEDYVKRRDMASYVDELWDRIGTSLRAGGVTAEDIPAAVREARRAKEKNAGRR